MRRKLAPLMFLPALVLLTSLACGLGQREELAPSALVEKGAEALEGAVGLGTYLKLVAQQVATVSQSQDNLEQLLQSPELGNARWTGSVRAQLAVVNLACSTLQGVEPPPEAEAVHNVLLQACGDCKETVDQVLDGIDGLDPNALNLALASGQSCATGFRDSGDLLEKVTDKLDLPSLGLSSDEVQGPPAPPPTVNTGANLRQGPGTGYPRVGGLREGTVIVVVGRDQAGDWLAIETEGVDQAWIAAFLVDNYPGLKDLPVLPAP